MVRALKLSFTASNSSAKKFDLIHRINVFDRELETFSNLIRILCSELLCHFNTIVFIRNVSSCSITPMPAQLSKLNSPYSTSRFTGIR